MSYRCVPTVLLALALTLGAQGGCSPRGDSVPVLRVGHAPHDHHSPLYVAASDPEYFRNNGGLHLQEKEPRKTYDLVDGDTVLAHILIDSSVGGKELIRRLSEDHFDLSFGGVPAMLSFIDSGSKIKIISPVMAEGAGLVVPAESELGDFDGFLAHLEERGAPFRVGYKAGISVQNLIFERALAERGVTFSKDLGEAKAQVVLVNVHGPKNLIPSMKSGIIDGFVVMQPYLALAESQGVGKTIALLNELPPEGMWEGNPCCALAATGALISEHPAAVESFLVLMMRANRYLSASPRKSAEAVAAWLDLPVEVEASSLPTISFTTGLDDTWERGVNFWISSMIETGFIKGRIKESFFKGEHNELLYDLQLYRKAREQI